MRDEVRQAAEREAIDIVTAARRDVRRIIVEARRELLVLTAQLHAAVDATEAPSLEPPPFTALLADPDARTRLEDASYGDNITRDVAYEGRRGVRSVLEEARAEIEALSAETPGVFAHASNERPAAENDDDERVSPVHELSLDASLEALDFQTRDLPIPTLAGILGTAPTAGAAGTPRLSELRSLLRDSLDTTESHEAPPAAPEHPVLSPDVEPLAANRYVFDTAPPADFFTERETSDPADHPLDAGTPGTDAVADAAPFTPSSRLFGEDETQSPVRSARTWVGLFAATGAVAVIGTIWWAVGRNSAPLSAAAPVITEKPAPAAAPAPAVTETPAVATTAPGTLALTIEARRPSWIRAQVDGKDETGRIYQAGETRHIYGARNVSIRAGDAGAVFVGIDGGSAKALGNDGAAVTKQFSAPATPAIATADSPLPPVATATATTPSAGATRTPIAETTAATRPQTAAPAAAAPSPTTAPRASAPAAEAGATKGDGVAGGRTDIVQAAQQWLDAYQRRDRDAMGAMSTDTITVSDERSVNERVPAWQGSVQRDLDEVALELTGDVAVFTARMTERSDAGGGQHVSRVSQFWQRRNGRWFVTNVRIIGEARLNQIIR